MGRNSKKRSQSKRGERQAAPGEQDAPLGVSVVEGAESLSRVELNIQLEANLARFWAENGVDLALTWLMMPPAARVEFVKTVVPDIKAEPAADDATSLLLPEMHMSVLQVLANALRPRCPSVRLRCMDQADMGKGLIAVMQTRASRDQAVDQADLALCKKLDKENKMPIFSGMEVTGKEGDAFKGDLAFVLNDGRIVVCGTDKSEEEKAQSRRMIAEGKVCDANQFITKNVRRTVLLQFCCGLADRYLEQKQLMENAPIESAIEEVAQNIANAAVLP